MILRYVAKDLARAKKQVALFVLNIAFGLFGLSLLQTFNHRLTKEVRSRSRQEAGADLLVSSRLAVDPGAKKEIEKAIALNGATFERGEVRELFTMAASPVASRLAALRVQDPNVPFYGELRFLKGEGRYDLSDGGRIWVEPEVLPQFHVEVGETLTIGSRAFVISKVVESDGSGRGMRTSIAPRIYMGGEDLENLGLIQKGSTVTYETLYRIQPDSKMASIVREAKRRVKDPSIRIQSHEEVSESNARAIRYLGDYLGLVSLVALTLSMMGMVYLLRAHIVSRMRDYAILKILGVPSSKLRLLLFVQSACFGALGSFLALLLCRPTFWILQDRITEWTDLPIQLVLDPMTALLVIGVGVGASVLCTLPFVSSVAKLPAQRLFSESGFGGVDILSQRLRSWIPILLLFVGLSIWQAHSLKTAGFFIVWLLGCALVLWGASYAWLRILKRFRPRVSMEFRHAELRLSRKPLESALIFIVVAFGALLVSMISTLEVALQHEFNPRSEGSQASLFLFDIQEEQLSSLQHSISTWGGTLDAASPLIRARLERVNDKPFLRDEERSIQSRDEETRDRSRSRTYNLTERANLSSSESVSEGRYVSGRFDPTSGEPAEISLDEGFARRVGLKVQDRLVFDVLGVPVEGRVVGLRRVRWASFQPNFFIQFQAGVFDDAPKSYLASISNLSEEAVQTYQNQIVSAFPNISVIDIRRVVARILEFTKIMAMALQTMAWLVFLSAMIVLLSIQAYHARRISREESILKMLGLDYDKVVRIRLMEILLWIFPAVATGFVLNGLASIPILDWLFNASPRFSVSSLSVFAFVAMMLGVHFMRVSYEKARK